MTVPAQLTSEAAQAATSLITKAQLDGVEDACIAAALSWPVWLVTLIGGLVIASPATDAAPAPAASSCTPNIPFSPADHYASVKDAAWIQPDDGYIAAGMVEGIGIIPMAEMLEREPDEVKRRAVALFEGLTVVQREALSDFLEGEDA